MPDLPCRVSQARDRVSLLSQSKIGRYWIVGNTPACHTRNKPRQGGFDVRRAISSSVGLWPLVIAMALSLTAPTAAQTCARLAPDGESLGYKKRGNDARCEGFYQQLSSGSAGVKVLSLTYGRPDFDPARHRALHLALAQAPTEAISIRGAHIEATRWYQLDTELKPGQSGFRLPLTDVIKPGGMTRDQFGVYAFRSLGAGIEELLPVAVGADADPTVPPDARVWIVLRPAIDISRLRYRVSASGSEPEFRFVPKGQGPIPKYLPIAFDLGPLPAGKPRLELRFVTSSGDDKDDTIRIGGR